MLALAFVKQVPVVAAHPDMRLSRSAASAAAFLFVRILLSPTLEAFPTESTRRLALARVASTHPVSRLLHAFSAPFVVLRDVRARRVTADTLPVIAGIARLLRR